MTHLDTTKLREHHRQVRENTTMHTLERRAATLHRKYVDRELTHREYGELTARIIRIAARQLDWRS